MKFAVIFAIGPMVALGPQLAAAELACYSLTQIEHALDTEYSETHHFSGGESTGIEYRLYVNAKTGSWSWIGIPAGTKVGCLIFAGRNAQPRNELPAPAAPPWAQF